MTVNKVSFSCFQLTYVNRISIVYTVFNVSNLFITSIDAVFSYGWAIVDYQATISDLSIANCYGTFISKIYIVAQCIFYFSAVFVASLFYSEVFTAGEFNSFTISNSLSCCFRISSSITRRFNVEAVHCTKASTANCHFAISRFGYCDTVSTFNIYFTAVSWNICAISLDCPDIVSVSECFVTVFNAVPIFLNCCVVIRCT